MVEQMTGALYADFGGGFQRIVENAEIELGDTFEAVSHAAQRLADELREANRSITLQMKAIEPAIWILSAVDWETKVGDAWRAHHPGRRLPGSLRNLRLAKKRAQYLERWAREQGLA